MIYKGTNAELRAFQWGVDEAPDWILKANTKQAMCRTNTDRKMIITQPEGNKDLIDGEETAYLCDFIVLTKGGSFQVYKPEHFYRIFISKTAE